MSPNFSDWFFSKLCVDGFGTHLLIQGDDLLHSRGVHILHLLAWALAMSKFFRWNLESTVWKNMKKCRPRLGLRKVTGHPRYSWLPYGKKKWCRFLFLSCPLKLNSLIEQISKKNVKVKANDPPLSSFDSLSQQRLQRCLAPCPSMSHVAWRG